MAIAMDAQGGATDDNAWIEDIAQESLTLEQVGKQRFEEETGLLAAHVLPCPSAMWISAAKTGL